jgi:hypothetical protein
MCVAPRMRPVTAGEATRAIAGEDRSSQVSGSRSPSTRTIPSSVGELPPLFDDEVQLLQTQALRRLDEHRLRVDERAGIGVTSGCERPCRADRNPAILESGARGIRPSDRLRRPCCTADPGGTPIRPTSHDVTETKPSERTCHGARPRRRAGHAPPQALASLARSRPDPLRPRRRGRPQRPSAEVLRQPTGVRSRPVPNACSTVCETITSRQRKPSEI